MKERHIDYTCPYFSDDCLPEGCNACFQRAMIADIEVTSASREKKGAKRKQKGTQKGKNCSYHD